MIVVHGGNASIANSLDDALAASFGQAAPVPPTGPGPPPTGTVASLLQQALDHFRKAQQALANQDLATYQSEINQAQRLIQQAAQLAGKSPSPSPSPTPSASPSG